MKKSAMIILVLLASVFMSTVVFAGGSVPPSSVSIEMWPTCQYDCNGHIEKCWSQIVIRGDFHKPVELMVKVNGKYIDNPTANGHNDLTQPGDAVRPDDPNGKSFWGAFNVDQAGTYLVELEQFDETQGIVNINSATIKIQEVFIDIAGSKVTKDGNYAVVTYALTPLFGVNLPVGPVAIVNVNGVKYKGGIKVDAWGDYILSIRIPKAVIEKLDEMKIKTSVTITDEMGSKTYTRALYYSSPFE